MARRRDRTGSRRNRRYLLLAVLVMLMAGGWVVLWKYAAGRAEESLNGWRAREARAGRIYSCGEQTIGGFPFRIEVLCDGAAALFRGSQPALELKTRNIHIAAQVYQPNLLISEFAGPLTIAEPGRPPMMAAKWSLMQSSVRGTPATPERVSIVINDPALDRANPSAPILKAKRIEIHGRLAEGSVADRPAIEIAVHSERLSAPAAGPLAVVPIDADIDGVLRGLKDFSPKPWAARFREIQANGGRIDIRQARVKQGETVAVGSGTLTINAQGRLEGQLNVAVAGLESFVNAVGAATQQRAGFGFTLGLGLLGGNATVEGRPAIAMPLRVSDGEIFLGPLKIGQIASLF